MIINYEDVLMMKMMLEDLGYKVIKFNKDKQNDAKECEQKGRDCAGCACNVCLAQL